MKNIRVGTDCSGIEAPIQALLNLKIPFTHVFSCDIDPYCRESIKANYSPEILYEDMTTRKTKELPDIDLYICGFPCQSFSSAGLRKGIKEKRGQIFWHCLDVIKTKKPSIFLLENVKGLLSSESGKTFETIIESLESLKCYDISYQILDTKDFGIPQHRERLFILGIKKNSKYNYDALSDINSRKMKSIDSFIDKNDKNVEDIPPYIHKSKLLTRIPEDSVFIDIGFTLNNFPNSNRYCPSLTTGGNLWCVPMQRHANIKELLSLQKFPKKFKQVVSNHQMKKQIGNSMSVNVLEEIFKNVF